MYYTVLKITSLFKAGVSLSPRLVLVLNTEKAASVNSKPSISAHETSTLARFSIKDFFISCGPLDLEILIFEIEGPSIY